MVACEIPAEIQVPVKVMGFFDLQLPVRQTAPPTKNPKHLDFPPKEAWEPVRLLGSCNGLAAVALNATEDLFIWNPTTGDYRKLPDPFLSSEAYLSQLFVYGFGYDSSTDVYKLFLGRTEGVVQSSMEAEIFSLRRNSWRMIENPPYLETNYSNNGTETPCSFVNEALLWLVGWSMSFNREFHDILYFDSAGENFDESSPLHWRGNPFNLRFCLTFSIASLFPSHSWWVMEDFGSTGSWTRLLRTESNYLCSFQAFRLSERRAVLLIIRDEDDDDDDEAKFKKFSIRKDPEQCEAVADMESLVSPHFY
ncbi:hypothetical protein QUC31_016352 [Theobroma cacao]|uniref:F-box associated beta-propeller type 1 domain-containing protein n=2 Tax=Theobroma cacao TaxID=3641 RepID=A0A061ENQ1_THECC|nr:PREDICTED: F-box/kelch-repeat protein At3g06240 [Theobroma cacao]EOY06273.1 Uncharacterized protein TCM_021060 [Theobroma cacao]